MWNTLFPRRQKINHQYCNTYKTRPFLHGLNEVVFQLWVRDILASGDSDLLRLHRKVPQFTSGKISVVLSLCFINALVWGPKKSVGRIRERVLKNIVNGQIYHFPTWIYVKPPHCPNKNIRIIDNFFFAIPLVFLIEPESSHLNCSRPFFKLMNVSATWNAFNKSSPCVQTKLPIIFSFVKIWNIRDFPRFLKFPVLSACKCLLHWLWESWEVVRLLFLNALQHNFVKFNFLLHLNLCLFLCPVIDFSCFVFHFFLERSQLSLRGVQACFQTLFSPFCIEWLHG